jgi:hypothetical protein
MMSVTTGSATTAATATTTTATAASRAAFKTVNSFEPRAADNWAAAAAAALNSDSISIANTCTSSTLRTKGPQATVSANSKSTSTASLSARPLLERRAVVAAKTAPVAAPAAPVAATAPVAPVAAVAPVASAIAAVAPVASAIAAASVVAAAKAAAVDFQTIGTSKTIAPLLHSLGCSSTASSSNTGKQKKTKRPVSSENVIEQQAAQRKRSKSGSGTDMSVTHSAAAGLTNSSTAAAVDRHQASSGTNSNLSSDLSIIKYLISSLATSFATSSSCTSVSGVNSHSLVHRAACCKIGMIAINALYLM